MTETVGSSLSLEKSIEAEVGVFNCLNTELVAFSMLIGLAAETGRRRRSGCWMKIQRYRNQGGHASSWAFATFATGLTNCECSRPRQGRNQGHAISSPTILSLGPESRKEESEAARSGLSSGECFQVI